MSPITANPAGSAITQRWRSHPERPVTEVADRYGVPRQSAHVWLRRYWKQEPFRACGSQSPGAGASLAEVAGRLLTGAVTGCWRTHHESGDGVTSSEGELMMSGAARCWCLVMNCMRLYRRKPVLIVTNGSITRRIKFQVGDLVGQGGSSFIFASLKHRERPGALSGDARWPCT